MTITTRAGKTSALTHAELDANFTTIGLSHGATTPTLTNIAGINSSGTYLLLKYNNTGGGGIQLQDSAGGTLGYFYGDGGDDIGILNASGQWAYRVQNSTAANIIYCANNPEFYVYTTYTVSPGSSRAPIFYDSNNTSYYVNPSSTSTSFRAAGNVLINGYVTAGYSDERLKDIEGNISDAVEKVKSLDGFYYKGNETAAKYDYDTEKRQVGLSAQQVEAVLPEIVKDAAIGDGFKTVDYSRVVPLLVEAIKEQQDQIDELKSEIKALKG